MEPGPDGLELGPDADLEPRRRLKADRLDLLAFSRFQDLAPWLLYESA
jgi:hypothetical protein